jgi:hypothetical protein
MIEVSTVLVPTAPKQIFVEKNSSRWSRYEIE